MNNKSFNSTLLKFGYYSNVAFELFIRFKNILSFLKTIPSRLAGKE